MLFMHHTWFSAAAKKVTAPKKVLAIYVRQA
jgi:hypothetical protein